MVIVAVAGGTGGVGRALVEAFASSGKHEVYILARKANPDLQKEIGVPIIPVDYSNIEETTKTLEDNHIHTLVSAVTMIVPIGTPPELELIRAADASKTTKRMVSSGWAVPYTEEQAELIPAFAHKLVTKAALKETSLEYTVVQNGCFLDYWCMNTVKSYMVPATTVIDTRNNAASIPGSGNTPVVFTHTSDVAKYVVALLDLNKWEPESFVVGDKVTLNEFLHLSEEAKGTKFTVTYDSVEKLKAGQATELPCQVAEYEFMPKEIVQQWAAVFGFLFETGVFNIPPPGTKTLNEVFAEIKPLKVKEILDGEWKKA
ncbi:hypothetical protein PENPOL_c002G01935 [Penicillium polonicum]|uniref:NmrA-like domain-containing protein n=1 Tax=Penicillium polonicum TaxID=60169 RepID=A0A1V6NWA4_PENPO|nr:hypothetical protein PENPOL_c002G01935 [Penicillium polonicum]